MPTILASAILDKAEVLLQDTTNVRWTSAELLGWLNDGQREIVSVRPDANPTVANITLVTGTKQSLPSTAYQLLDIVRNMGSGGTTPGRAVRKVPQELLDSQVPEWHAAAANAVTLHYTYDPRTPRTFYVYPPAVAGQQLESKYSTAPTDVAAVGNAITIDDIYHNALLDYVMYRAYLKDFELTGNDTRAKAYRDRFEATLGLKAKADAASQQVDEVKG